MTNIFRLHPSVLSSVYKVFLFDFFYVVFGVFYFITLSIYGQKYTVKIIGVLCLFALFFTVPTVVSFDVTKITYLFRILYYIFFFAVFLWPWLTSDPKAIDKLASIIVVSLYPMVFIVFFQLVQVPLFTEIVHFCFNLDKLRSLESTSPRVFGSFFNANWFGVYIVTAFNSTGYLFKRHILSYKKFFPLLFICFILLFMSGSRTAFLTVAISLVYILSCFQGRSDRHSKKIFSIFSFLLIFVLSINLFDLFRLFALFSKRFALFFNQGFEIISATKRFEEWREALSFWMISPIFGPGMTGTPHNSYLTTMLNFGLLGTCFLIIFLMILFYRVMINRHNDASLFSGVVVFCFLVMAGTADFFYTTQVFILILPFLYLGSVLNPLISVERKSAVQMPPDE